MDKVIHSAVGLGSYLTVILAFICLQIGAWWMILFIPVLLAIGKELIDHVRYRGFDWSEVKATLNPSIVLKWYKEKIT